MTHAENLTPLMRQYFETKEQYPNTILLFQVGDFYELFFEDAKVASSFLGIALTARGKNNGDPIPLCGVPIHALDHYLNKLVKGGFNVAVCDQLEQAKPGTMVKRGVTRVLTPGTLTDSQLLDDKKASYLFSFFPKDNEWGLLFGELLTGQLFATTVPADKMRMVESELSRFFPDEILVPQSALGKKCATRFRQLGYFTTPLSYEVTDEQSAELNTWVSEQFKSSTVDTLASHESLRLALYYFYAYVKRNQGEALSQFNSLHWYQPEDFLLLDAATQRNLELVKNAHDGTRKHTLFSILDHARTPMGSRMIQKWLLRPLMKKKAIEQRHDVVGLLVSNVILSQTLEDLLIAVGDIERIVGRIALKRAPLHDYLALTRALYVTPRIKALMQPFLQFALIAVIDNHIADFDALHDLLLRACNDDPSRDWIIKEGFDSTLDHVRALVLDSNQKITVLERQEQERTGINSLKIRYNKVHGYYVEITKTNAHLVPADYMRQQTLVGRERYMMPALQELQSEILSAHEKIEALEHAVFERVKNTVVSHITLLRKLSHALAHLDALLGFAHAASSAGYVRPQIVESRDIMIKNGRHPVVECVGGNTFVPNDTLLNDAQSLIIITGPNMGGKSTYLRQVALVCIMAQTGSFIPAQSAQLPILDRIFTRIGAGDNVAEGKSTFLVEMEETAVICTQATVNSLVILDEVGRGTSTFDGLAIAHAVVEYLYTKIGARALFATHYHELTRLQDEFTGIASFYAASMKTKDGIVFLYTMKRGVADGSFGVEVAKLAQLPASIIVRAQELLQQLHAQEKSYHPARIDIAATHDYEKMQKDEERYQAVMNLVANVSFDDLSPKKAFDLIWQLKERISYDQNK